VRTPAERRRARRRLTAGRYGYVVLFLSPWIIGFVLFTAWPMLLSLYYSFTSYDLLTKPRFIGLDNYRFMFGVGTIGGRHEADPYFWQSVRNTIWIIAITVPLRVIVAMLTAMLLTRPKRGVNVYRTLFFMPSLAPTVGSALVFVYLLNPSTGPVDQLLSKIPGIGTPLWFYDPAWAKPALVVLGLWGIGDAIVIYLAGLLDVPRDLYEAIAIEGANAWQRFRNVTLPMLTPVIFFTLVIGIINGFQYFDQAFVSSTTAGQTPGDPQGSLLFYGVWVYEQAFTYFHMGYASALAWVLFLATMATTAVLFVTAKRWVHYRGGLS
jgi:multiple sugar transport system permease protein